VPQLELPSESQWEAACSCDAKPPTPFHFGATLDGSWARYKFSKTYGRGRKGAKGIQPWSNGSSGLVNRWGLAELHGQLFEWCADLWNRDPRPAVQRQRGWFGSQGDAGAAPVAGAALELPDPALKGNIEQSYRLLRGGSWYLDPHFTLTAFRNTINPDGDAPTSVYDRAVLLPQAPYLVFEPFALGLLVLPWLLACWAAGLFAKAPKAPRLCALKRSCPRQPGNPTKR
jgi:formylglycine-generating enzyme required for sulfatase activity